MNATIDELLRRYHDKLDTRAILVESGAIDRAAAILQAELPAGPWLVAVDANTWRVAGARLAEVLDAAGQPWQRWDTPLELGETSPGCDDARVEAFEAALGSGNDGGANDSGGAFVAGIAVGSGTINDIVKLACHRRGLAMACVGTAPSMNGYTSGIAAVLSDGVKTTVPCAAPRVVIADVDVMAEAPARMIQSGLGDLISKPVSNSDWALSSLLNGTPHSKDAMAIIEAGAALLEGVAPRLPARDRDAVGGLVGSLILSGLAMSVAGSSSPASGGEHLISHYIDMTAHAFGEAHDFHGCQVGVGTLTTAALYERLRELDPATIDVEARVAALPAWPDYEAELRERFGPLFDAVVCHARPGYPSAQVLRERLTTLVARWDEIMAAVGHTLRTRRSIEDELVSAGCPVRFRDLDVDEARARRAVVHSKDIRNRYTILHLAWELGTLDAWADDALAGRDGGDDGLAG